MSTVQLAGYSAGGSSSNHVACSFRASAQLSIPTSTLTTLTYDTTLFNNGFTANLATGQVTIPVSGMYAITAAVTYAADTLGNRSCGIYINGVGSRVNRVPASSVSEILSVQVTTCVLLNAGDVVDARVYQSSTTGALSTVVAPAQFMPGLSLVLL